MCWKLCFYTVHPSNGIKVQWQMCDTCVGGQTNLIFSACFLAAQGVIHLTVQIQTCMT